MELKQLEKEKLKTGLAKLLILAMVWGFVPMTAMPVQAAPGDVIQTPTTPMELPVEVEIELGPAASLKQAPLWNEIQQLLVNPYEPVIRRPGFGVPMPPLNIWPLDYNFLTAQPLRLRTSDGEISWDQPGPLFDPDEVVATDAYNAPIELRTIIGELYADADNNLVVRNPELGDPGPADPRIPPNGTIVAVPAFFDGMLHELDAATGEFEPVVSLETPVNENDFLVGKTWAKKQDSRLWAEVLGKALFWDMQVGSDSVQACGSCHFNGGADNRTRNQLNPNHLGGDGTLQVVGPNEEVIAADFPFHMLLDPDLLGEPLVNPGNVLSDSNDIMSSMGVRFREFVDIPPIGTASLGPPSPIGGVRPLLPDIGRLVTDPFPDAFTDPVTGDNLRRVEPRNTPTFHGAAFNFDNFWDGRARFNFNGGSVFGPADDFFHVFIQGRRGQLLLATNGMIRPDLDPDDLTFDLPVRVKFSSLASQAMGPPLSDFEMSFQGRNWAKLGKKLLQSNVTPLANQLVATDDSILGPFSNQHIAAGMPGLSVSYGSLIRRAFRSDLWDVRLRHLNGAPDASDPFDGYSLTVANRPASRTNTNQFTQMEANFALFFGLAVQIYEELVIPDDSPLDRFMDANPLAGNGVGEAGALEVLHPALIPGLVGPLILIPDDPSTPEYDGFGPDEVYGFDIFAGANLTAALPVGSPYNPASTLPDGTVFGTGSNPFARTARCVLCHLGPEQTDNSINIAHGILKGNAEFEYPSPPIVEFPPDSGEFLPAPEPPGPIAFVGGLILAEELEGPAQDAVEVEPRAFAMVDYFATPWDDRIIAQQNHFAFGDQGMYNIGLRPVLEDIGRGGDDPFGWPLSLSALTLKNIGGVDYEPYDSPSQPGSGPMANFDPEDIEATFEETGDGVFFPGTTHTLQSINPGFERDPVEPQLPGYLAPYVHALPAGELHPQIDEMAGMLPNVITPPNGGPAIEFGEVLFGADLHSAVYDPATFGDGPPNFGWGPRSPNNQSGVAGNLDYPVHGTWPAPNRVLRNGAFKAPSLRNVALTGPYFHTGSYLTLRQVVDFYMRGGDFPITNLENRDPHILNIEEQAFGFGRTAGDDFDLPVNFGFLVGTFADALPDTAYRYDAMPDTDHPLMPEPAFATPEAAKVALVRFMLALTDPRVKYEMAPFDRPEIFVPIDGTAPDNTGGRVALMADARFLQVPAVGAAGNGVGVSNFLGISDVPVAGPNNDHFDR